MKKLLRHLTNAPVAIALAFLLVGAPTAPMAKMLPGVDIAEAAWMGGGCRYTIHGCDYDGDGVPMNSLFDQMAEQMVTATEAELYRIAEEGEVDLTYTGSAFDAPHIPWPDANDAAMCDLADTLDTVSSGAAATAVVALLVGASTIPLLAASVVARELAKEIRRRHNC